MSCWVLAHSPICGRRPSCTAVRSTPAAVGNACKSSLALREAHRVAPQGGLGAGTPDAYLPECSSVKTDFSKAALHEWE